MGIPGSETALEELMRRILQEGSVAKLADNQRMLLQVDNHMTVF
jgi:hypothetical protein